MPSARQPRAKSKWLSVADPAPWRITTGVGELKADGKLEVAVTGLVLVGTGANPFFTGNPAQPAAGQGFSAQVTCAGGNGAVGNSNVVGPFPTTSTGNTSFETRVTLPSPCNAPIVLVGAVVNGTFRWFAQSIAEVDR